MGRKKIYPYNRWDTCCYCGKFTLNVIECHDNARRPHYCNQECATARHSAVRKGEMEPITSDAIRKKRKEYYEKLKGEGYSNGKRPVVKPREKKGRRGVESIKGPTSFEDRLWGKK